jgi:golgi apyrase
VPPSLHSETPIFLLATAGMRLLPPEKQAEILRQTCHFFTHHSHFRIDSPSADGPCGSSVRIITGEEEGLFGWLAVNYLMDGFTGPKDQRTTYGFLDMGGASTQIAFEPKNSDTQNLIDVRLRLLSGEEIHHKVFVTTWLGYGTNQARERYVGQTIEEFERNRTGSDDVVSDPCLPKDLSLTETPVHLGPASEHAATSHELKGTGSFEQCLKRTSSLLNKDAPCPDSPCLMNGIHVPPIDFSASHFIGVSEYWYSSEHVFGLGGAYDFVQYELAASQFCSREWDDIVQEHERSRQETPNTGDGEVEKDGKVVAVGKWGSEVEIPRLQMQCFKAAWIANVLHEGLGMPRIVDPGGQKPPEADNVEQAAQEKGLGRPTFQSVDTVGDIAISWTLGKMVLEASKQVPLPSKTDRPLGDPLDDAIQSGDSPVKPIRPFLDLEALEDTVTAHLQSQLSRSSLGFSPLLFLLCVAFVALVLIGYPFRRTCRSACLRSIRRAARSSRDAEIYMLAEEGKPLNGGSSRPSTPTTQRWLMPLRRMLSHSSPRSHRPPPISIVSPGSSSAPQSPISNGKSLSRSMSFPNSIAASATSRSSSPSPGFAEDGGGFYNRSRNSSQINLSGSGLASRAGAISRVSSMSHLSGD